MKKISRRDFLKASAATSGGALLTACGSSGSSTASTATSTSSAESGPRTVSYWNDLANTSGADVKSMGTFTMHVALFYCNMHKVPPFVRKAGLCCFFCRDQCLL